MALTATRKQLPDNASEAKRAGAYRAPKGSPRRHGASTRPFMQRKRACTCGGGCPRCEVEDATEAEPRTASQIVHEVLRSPGQPLDPTTRALMEPRFGHDFSRVRVHTDRGAIESARAVSALAYTVGRHIVFAEGQSVWHTASGRHSLAHELAHVVQQERGGFSSPAPERGGVLERAADAAASDFVAGRGPIRVGGASAPVLARQAVSGARSTGAVPGPRSLRESLMARRLTDAELMQEIDLIRERLVANPLESFESIHLSLELERLQAEEWRRTYRAYRRQKHQEDLARVIEAVNAGRIPRWMKVFPFRPSRGPFRMDVAPIFAWRKGENIVVQQPRMSVAFTDRFKKDVRTLPGDVFSRRGHTLRPNELVGVRLYDEGEKVIVVRAKDLLQFSEASHGAMFAHIALSAASVAAGPVVSRLGGRVVGATVGASKRLAQRGLVAATLGTAEAAPTALGGIASRTSIVLVEGRAASTVAQQAIGQTTVRAGAQTAVQSTIRTGAQTVAPTVSPSLTGLAGTAGGIAATQVAGSTLVQVSPAEYAARLSFVTPQQFDNPVLNAVERAGQQAAAVLANPANPSGARFIQVCRNRNWTLAGTLFHAEAARQLRAIAPSLSGIQITAEDVVQAGRGGSRLDVTAVDASRNHYDIDWKTTGRSALTVRSRAEMRRHAAQYQASRGAPLDLQISKSWVDFVRSLIPNVNWPK